MKRTNLSGIFAAVFVAATVITLASCSQDDEYYEDGLFTRADEMMTRSGGDPGEGGEISYFNRVYSVGEKQLHFFRKGSTVELRSTRVEIFVFANETLTSFGVNGVVKDSGYILSSATLTEQSRDSTKVKISCSIKLEDSNGYEWNAGFVEECLLESFQ